MRGIDQEAWYGAAVPGVAEPRQGDAGAVVQARSGESRLGPGYWARTARGGGRMNHDTDRNGQRRGHYSAVRTSLPALPSLLEPLYVIGDRKQPPVGGQKRNPSEITHPPLLDPEAAPKRSQRPSPSSKR
jgi:hypothetical protein